MSTAPENDSSESYESQPSAYAESERRVGYLCDRFRRKFDIPQNQSVGLDDIAEFLDQTPDLSANSKRSYRYHIRNIARAQDTLEAQRALKIIDNDNSQYTVDPSPIRDHRQRFVTKAEANLIYDAIVERRHHSRALYHIPAALLLRATLAVGLRPNEWENAKLIDRDGKIWLEAPNSKQSGERTFGPTRLMALNALTEQDLKYVDGFMQTLAYINGGIGFDRFYNAARRLLDRVNEELWPDRTTSITYYSCRHEFVNRIKRYLPEEYVAALLGHRADDSSLEYGRHRGGYAQKVHAGPIPEPHPENVRAVKRSFETKNPQSQPDAHTRSSI